MRIVIVGGGPAGYESALVARQLGADVTVVDRDGLGGACVLTDCVPSKTLIASSDAMTALAAAGSLGIRFRKGGGATWEDEDPDAPPEAVTVDPPTVFGRVKTLALAQSLDIATRLAREGVNVVQGSGRLVDAHHVAVRRAHSDEDDVIEADIVLLALGAHPRVVPGAEPDGERILTWRDVYDLPELPERLIVVGSGVTGAEFAGAFQAMGSHVTLVSSRDRVLPGEDADAAAVIEGVFARRGMTILNGARAVAATRVDGGVVVTLEDGRTVEGTHALMTVGSIPSTTGLGLAEAGVRLTEGGYIAVDKVSRTSVSTIYAAGDCTGVLMLASVAAMQGRIAMWHALGEAVAPINLGNVSATIFTDPEIATVGVRQADVDAGTVYGVVKKLPLATNARAKMQGITDGFVKLICRPESGKVLGGVIVAPRASELILPVTMAVSLGLNVDQVAHTFAIYPSLSGSLTEAARQLHQG
ncbi:MAG TPA: NAD(P)H-quinone dehydrogenase [Mycobacteriales bacterium]|jgi:dihydrolipoamide dehydrogenase|nr:NAD(P)H-quinone dehydrogenase [Mycobacteriales bacterium]